jgi:hypothetical protein
MRKTVLTVALMGFAIGAYSTTALGAGPTGGHGHIRLVSSDKCNLVFEVSGFTPGSFGRVEFSYGGHTYSVPVKTRAESSMYQIKLEPYIGETYARIAVEYRVAIQGMGNVISGTARVDCRCGEHYHHGGDEGGDEGGPGTPAGPATPVASQPGFAG